MTAIRDHDGEAIWAAQSRAREDGSLMDEVPALIELLKEGGTEWDESVDALAEIGRPAVPALTDALSRTDTRVRRGAIQALGQIGPDARSSVPVLSKGLWDEDAGVRLSTVIALGKIGSATDAAIARLAEMMSTPRNDSKQDDAEETQDIPVEVLLERETPVQAAIALWRIDGRMESTLPLIIDAVKQGDLTAMDAVGEMGELAIDAVPVLAKMIEGARPKADYAAVILGKIGPAAREAIPSLMEAMQEGEDVRLRIYAAQAVWKIDGRADAAVEVLAEILQQEPNPFIKINALWPLREIGRDASEAAPAIESILKHDEPDVRVHAAATLWDVTGEVDRPMQVLVEVLERKPKSSVASEAGLLKRAVDELATMGADARDAVPALERLKQHSHAAVREAARKALDAIAGNDSAAPSSGNAS